MLPCSYIHAYFVKSKNRKDEALAGHGYMIRFPSPGRIQSLPKVINFNKQMVEKCPIAVTVLRSI